MMSEGTSAPATNERAFDGLGAVVTGAGNGVGRAVARRLAAAGASVLAVDVDGEALRALADDVGPSCRPHQTDLLADGAAEAYVDAALAAFGRVDVFHNNAGVLGSQMPIVDTADGDFDMVFSVNVRAVFLGLRAVLRTMRDAGRGGAIVNTASTATQAGSKPGRGVYGASKHAVVGLTRSAATEAGHYGVRVNAVSPGAVDTAMLRTNFDRLDPDLRDRTISAWTSKVPLRRFAEPDDVALAVCWLLSPEASYLTGANYVVDGGMSA